MSEGEVSAQRRSIWEFKDDIEAEFAGTKLTDLGFVGLECEPIPITSLVWKSWLSDLFVDETGERPWVNGAVGEHGAHVTLLYGLLRPAHEYGDLVRKLLEGIPIEPTKVIGIEQFGSPEDPYACLVARLEVAWGLIEANRRLRWLPHVDTFVEYKPHVTLAYVRRERAKAWYDQLNKYVVGRYLTFGELALGGDLLA